MKPIKTITMSILTIGLLAGSAIGVSAQGAVVTGTLTVEACTDSSGNPVKVEVAAFMGAALVCTGTAEFDDSRLTGEYETTSIPISDSGGVGFSDAFIDARDTRITNAEGSWFGRAVSYVGYVTEDGENVEVYEEEPVTVLFGEDAYDGLVAILRESPEEDPVVGIIVDGNAEQ